MYKKLILGEYGLKDTFWRFIVLGSSVFYLVVKFLAKMLTAKLSGMSLVTYYTKYFRPLYLDTDMLMITAAYLVAMVLFIFYCITILRAVWAASEQYERSIWLARASKFMSVVIIGNYLYALF